MKRVTGLGGFFFKTPDPAKLKEWYARHLGIPMADAFDGWAFQWRNAEDPSRKGATIWALFPDATPYFDPPPGIPGRAAQPFMCNFRVDDLDALLAELGKEGVKIDPKREDSDFGRFAWVYDPDGNKVELWEPPEGQPG
jgi:catechol 2,3-dioxygenase-like lactoylglutathione lyase family enzyme